MRKITKLAVEAFLNGNSFGNSFTKVSVIQDTVIYELYGSKLAQRKIGDKTFIVYAPLFGNKFTNTTRERLNGLPNVDFRTKNGVLFLNGEKWDFEKKFKLIKTN